MKPFDLEKAKAGAPVCTKDGRDARIIYFNAKGEYPIIALISNYDIDHTDIIEDAISYTNNGKFRTDYNSLNDLMMKDVHHEGWINIYKGNLYIIECGSCIYNSEEEAKKYKHNTSNYITTIKIEWDE